MHEQPQIRTGIYFILIIIFVVGLSALSTSIWGGKPEQTQRRNELIINKEMTINRFGQANALPHNALKAIFDLKTQHDLEKKLDEYGTPDQVTAMVTKKLALASEHAGKNWIKIPIKFALWLIFLSTVFILFKKRKVTSGVRNRLLLTAILIFGVILGPDPNPMGTVKDAIVLYGTTHAIFPPRMIALSLFLAIVFFCNKYICAWGCQAGTLQELIFRINQSDKQKAVIGRQIKLPFALTNTVRFVFLCGFTLIVFLWGLDIIGPIDLFKIYKPAHLGFIGGVFAGLLLFAGLFIYRPWCHLFCPFGFAGWLVEKASLVKISVDYDTCIACGKCAAACPSTVMGAILRRDKTTIPDCFACYTCREICPTDSIRFSTRKRTMPPSGHFNQKKKDNKGI